MILLRILTLGLLFHFGYLEALTEPQINIPEVNQKEWDRSNREVEWTTTKKALMPKKNEKKAEKQDSSIKLNIPGARAIIQIIAFILIASLIGLIIYFLTKYIEAETKLSEIEKPKWREIENIQAENFEEKIYAAEKDGNYKLALRMHYLRILQILSIEKRIIWTNQKTNRQYVNEMSNDTSYSFFKQIVNLFERSWYGNITIEKSHYDQLRYVFRSFEKSSHNS